jgi:hypothetical protein
MWGRTIAVTATSAAARGLECRYHDLGGSAAQRPYLLHVHPPFLHVMSSFLHCLQRDREFP